jgi:hypothetical protein
MDSSRLKAIWEYAISSKDATQEDVMRACAMYMGRTSDNEASLKVAVADLVTAIGTSSSKLLDAILLGQTDLAKLLSASAPSSDQKPSQSVLKTILDDNLVNEEEEDSSVDGEGVSSNRLSTTKKRFFR